MSASLNGMPDALREADRRWGAGVRDADDEVRVDGSLPRETLAHADASTVHLDAADPRVRASEVDVLEDAQRVTPSRNGLGSVYALVVDPHDLARAYVANDLGPDEVERARLGRDDPVVSDAAERERAEAERVTERDERPVHESRDRVRALEAGHRSALPPRRAAPRRARRARR